MDMCSTEIPILVNCDRPLPRDYAINLELIEGSPDMRCDRRCAQPLAGFIAAAKDAGFHPAVLSAYRDRKAQNRCFGQRVDMLWAHGMTLGEALAEARRYVAAPGFSEHETGLAFDIKDAGYKKRNAGLDNAPGQRWLMAHCHEFGFILRYPANKEHITHVVFEPCHYRYVGESHAAKIVEHGLTLEEYVGILEGKAQQGDDSGSTD